MKIGIDIDDSISNCNKVSKLGIATLLFTSKGNSKERTDFHRVKEWKEIYEKIKENKF